MATRATILVALTASARPGARAAVYADNGAGSIDYTTILAEQPLFRPPGSVLDAYGQRRYGQNRYGSGVGEMGYGRGVYGHSKYGRWQDTLSLTFDVPDALVVAGGSFLFEVDALNPGGVVPVGTTVATIDVSGSLTGNVTF